MAEVEYATTAKLPIETIWDFVQQMDNWATFVAGYQSHEKQSESDSTWVLKGDVGVLARTVRFAVHVEEWAGPSRVRFSLRGLNEPMQGEGSFLLERFEDPGAVVASAPRRGLFARLLEARERVAVPLLDVVAGRLLAEPPVDRVRVLDHLLGERVVAQRRGHRGFLLGV